MRKAKRLFNENVLAAPGPERAGLMGDMNAVIEVIELWRQQAHLPIARTVEHVGLALNLSGRDRRLMGAAAKLAAEPNGNPYHGNGHFLEVFFIAATLGNYARRMGQIDDKGLRNLLTAALIHDYGHDGKGNGGEQYRLENKAFTLAQPALRKAGFGTADLRQIHALVLATDVSRDFSKPDSISPADNVRNFVISGRETKLFPELRALALGNTANTALMLQDADVAASVVDWTLAGQNGVHLAAEMGTPYTQKSLLFFFNNICRRQMFSNAGFHLIQPLMDRTMKLYGVTRDPKQSWNPPIV